MAEDAKDQHHGDAHLRKTKRQSEEELEGKDELLEREPRFVCHMTDFIAVLQDEYCYHEANAVRDEEEVSEDYERVVGAESSVRVGILTSEDEAAEKTRDKEHGGHDEADGRRDDHESAVTLDCWVGRWGHRGG